MAALSSTTQDQVNPVASGAAAPGKSKRTEKYIDPRSGAPYYVDRNGRSTWSAPRYVASDGRQTFSIPVLGTGTANNAMVEPPKVDSAEHTWASRAVEIFSDVSGSDGDSDDAGNSNSNSGAMTTADSASVKLVNGKNEYATSKSFSRRLKSRNSGSKSPRFRPRGVSASSYNDVLKKTELCFKDLSVKIEKPPKGGRSYLLQGISGHIAAGEITALCGPSGSGKTTCLEALLGKGLPGLQVSGSVNAESRQNNGYVAQTDVLPVCSTVSELLHFHCAMKLPRTTSFEQRQMRVEALLDQFSLRKAKDMRIGSATIKGISGGEKRRLSMACALVTVAPLLYVDEATSGLSAFDALAVMHILKGLSYRGHTILITIHQPRQDIVDMFDKIMLLTRDGRLAYLGSPSKMVSHFENVCNIICPRRANTCDFALDALSAQGPKQAVSGEDFAHAFCETSQYKKMIDYLHGGGQAHSSKSTDLQSQTGSAEVARKGSFNVESSGLEDSGLVGSKGGAIVRTDGFNIVWEPADGSVISSVFQLSSTKGMDHRPSFTQKACQLFRRNFILEMRNQEIFAVQLGIAIELGVLMGSVYWQVDVNTDPFSVLALCFMVVVLQSLGAITVIPSFIHQRVLFSHEVSNGLYDTAAFSVAAFVSDILLQGLYAVGMSVPIFYMCGLGEDFGKFVSINIVGRLAATTWAELVCVFFSDTAAANGAASGMMSFFVMFAGFVITYDNLPVFWQWANKASMLKYFYSPLVVSIAHESKTTLAGKTQIQALSELDLTETAGWHIWMLAGYLALFRMIHAVSLSSLHTGRLSVRKKRVLTFVSIISISSIGCWFAFVPDALKLKTAESTVVTANSTSVIIRAPAAGVYNILVNTSDVANYDVYFATAHLHTSPAYPEAGHTTRRSWRLANESGIYMDETPVEVRGTIPDGEMSWTYLRHNINGFWRCPLIEKMQFAFRQSLVVEEGSTSLAPLTRLDLSAELLGAGDIESDNVGDVNQIIRQIQDILNDNAENILALSEARFKGIEYSRKHMYSISGYLCE